MEILKTLKLVLCTKESVLLKEMRSDLYFSIHVHDDVIGVLCNKSSFHERKKSVGARRKRCIYYGLRNLQIYKWHGFSLKLNCSNL